MREFRAVQEGERTDDPPVMSSVLRVCRKCGAQIFADAPEGLCTACLFETGLAGDDSDSVGENVESTDASAAAHVKKGPRPTKTRADFGDYELLEEIGRGGQGVVYRARQKSLNRTVAVKVIGLGHWATEAHLKRFRREAEAAASLEHPCIVPIYEVGERDGSCYFSMKFVEGGQLDEVVRREPMALRRAAELIVKVARTVHFAHEHHILHRDIKPGNILLDRKGEPHLTDFGLARLVETESTVTRTLEVLGTPSYMAPEQAVANNAQLTSATDVYGLGAVFYQLLTGHPPFAGGTTYETIKLLLETEPRQPRQLNPRTDRDLSTICLKCLEKDPKRRYSSALALAEDLEHWLKHEPIQARHTGVVTRGKKWVQRNPTSTLLTASLIALAAAAGWIVWKSEFIRHPVVTNGIAVLPFENLSRDPDNAYFAEGIQEEILTRLASVADLRVISRTSTQHYQSKPRNLSQIVKQLGVANILEGSVQKTGNKVRVNVQLIDTRADTHLWAKSYDRDFKDVLAVESEVSREIAEALKANLSPSESHALASVGTRDAEAYDLFLRGEYQFHQAQRILVDPDVYDRADAFYRQALARDPNFAEAAVAVTRSRLWRHWFVSRLAPGELEEVKPIIDRALALAPNSAEAHLALGLFFYWGHYQYEMALTEFNRALELQPNNALARYYCAAVYRRRGEWERALANFQRAQELDPRDARIPVQIGITYLALRQWKDAERAELRALAIDPHVVPAAIVLSSTRLNATGDIDSAWRALDGFPEVIKSLTRGGIGTGGDVADIIGPRVYLNVMGRRFTDAFQASVKEGSTSDLGHFQELAGRAALRVLAGQTEAAKSAGEEALPLLEAKLRERRDDTFAMTGLSWVYLALGRNDDALRLSKQAADTMSIEKDALDGPNLQIGLAQIEARAGAPEEAIKRLRRLLSIPAGEVASIARLKIDPVWDPIRNRPDFQQLLSGPEQIGPNK
jgi:serine/threonine protein kinase/tetratricopeptide (TPR) repeat protein